MVGVLEVAAVESGVSSVWGKLQQVRDELNGKYFEREAEIDGLLISALISEHCLLLGDPGTGKSALSEDVLGFVFVPDREDSYFECLMSDSLPPDELFGQYKLSALRDDRYERQTKGRLPVAKFAFLDEIFKCQTTLKTLFKILNERVFYNDGGKAIVPLVTCVGASNELPEDGEGLEALWDRFLLRYWVKPLTRSNRSKLRLGKAEALKTQITYAELVEMQQAVQEIEYSEEVDSSLGKLEEAIGTDGLHCPSDRRSKQLVKLLKGCAYLRGDSEVSEDHFYILAYALWEKSPDEIPKIKKQIARLENSLIAKLNDLAAAAREAATKAIDAKNRMTNPAQFVGSTELGTALGVVNNILREADQEIGNAKSNGLSKARADKAALVRSTIESKLKLLNRAVLDALAN